MDLRESLETLPQELFDEIFRLTFTADENLLHIRISYDSYKPADAQCSATFPSLLHVSRSTREIFARAYYGNPAGFTLQDDQGLGAGDFVRWLLFVPEEHREMIQQVSVYLGVPDSKSRKQRRLKKMTEWERLGWELVLDNRVQWSFTLTWELREKITVHLKK